MLIEVLPVYETEWITSTMCAFKCPIIETVNRSFGKLDNDVYSWIDRLLIDGHTKKRSEASESGWRRPLMQCLK